MPARILGVKLSEEASCRLEDFVMNITSNSLHGLQANVQLKDAFYIRNINHQSENFAAQKGIETSVRHKPGFDGLNARCGQRTRNALITAATTWSVQQGDSLVRPLQGVLTDSSEHPGSPAIVVTIPRSRANFELGSEQLAQLEDQLGKRVDHHNGAKN